MRSKTLRFQKSRFPESPDVVRIHNNWHSFSKKIELSKVRLLSTPIALLATQRRPLITGMIVTVQAAKALKSN